MTDHIGIGGAWKVKAGDWIGIGGSWKVIAGEWIGVGGAWKLMHSALAASATPETAAGYDSGYAAFGTVTSEQVTVSVSGGSGNYTYLWEHVSTASGNTPTISSASSTTPTWSALVTDGTESSSTWRVTVTDTTYNVTTTDTVYVALFWTSLS